MGIQDRDYMKRPPDDGGYDPTSPGSRVESFFSGLFAKHPRLLVILGCILGGLIILGAIWAKSSESNH